MKIESLFLRSSVLVEVNKELQIRLSVLCAAKETGLSVK